MTDFRMNKNQPIGANTITTIAGVNTRRKKVVKSSPKQQKPKVEVVTPNLYKDTRPLAEQLGSVIKPRLDEE